MPMYTAAEFMELDTGDTRCELVRGVLEVREPTFFDHGYTMMALGLLIAKYLETHHIGVIVGPASFWTERGPDTVRVPDLSFVSTEHLPERPRTLIEKAPDLAIEVLSKSNRPGEMNQKVAEFFASGAKMVWLVDPKRRTIAVHARDAAPFILGPSEVLDGGDVLPGFRLALDELFGWPPGGLEVSPG
jgi:Uma2 family endonuclease